MISLGGGAREGKGGEILKRFVGPWAPAAGGCAGPDPGRKEAQ